MHYLYLPGRGPACREAAPDNWISVGESIVYIQDLQQGNICYQSGALQLASIIDYISTWPAKDIGPLS